MYCDVVRQVINITSPQSFQSQPQFSHSHRHAFPLRICSIKSIVNQIEWYDGNAEWISISDKSFSFSFSARFKWNWLLMRKCMQTRTGVNKSVTICLYSTSRSESAQGVSWLSGEAPLRCEDFPGIHSVWLKLKCFAFWSILSMIRWRGSTPAIPPSITQFRWETKRDIFSISRGRSKLKWNIIDVEDDKDVEVNVDEDKINQVNKIWKILYFRSFFIIIFYFLLQFLTS